MALSGYFLATMRATAFSGFSGSGSVGARIGIFTHLYGPRVGSTFSRTWYTLSTAGLDGSHSFSPSFSRRPSEVLTLKPGGGDTSSLSMPWQARFSQDSQRGFADL